MKHGFNLHAKSPFQFAKYKMQDVIDILLILSKVTDQIENMTMYMAVYHSCKF